MLAHPRKRPRSPSPSPIDSITSPLDVLLKRRRQSHFDFSPTPAQPCLHPSAPNGHGDSSFPHAESSSAPLDRLVEKRRMRQWEKLNAPTGPPPRYSQSQPFAQPMTSLPDSSPLRPAHQRSFSQPDPAQRRFQMSSSPIQHHPPSSSPFRAHSEATRVEDPWIDEEGMRREWGEEYTAQNTLLHELHLARMAYHQPAPQVGHTPTPTPDMALLQTPHMPTPYRSGHFPSSSPFGSHTNTQTQYTPGYEDDGMEVEVPLEPGAIGEEEVKHRYEEANRLLAELAVVRRQRWGDTI